MPLVTIPQISKETKVETPRITDNIFEHLEERIKMLEESKVSGIESEGLEGLTPLEDKILKAAYTCRSQEEICLRLLMDPSEVEDVINSLMEKGYLDKDIKPKIPVARKRLSIKEADAEQVEKPVPKSRIEEDASLKDRREEVLPEKEMIEKLIASKMREDLKKKIETKEDSVAKEKPESGKVVIRQKTSQGDAEGILKEWKKASSLLWGEKTENEQEKP